MFQYRYKTAIGNIFIAAEEEFITNISFKELNYDYKETALIRNTYNQICEYLEGKRTCFDVPINFRGTPFQKSVWNALRKIPYGATATYKDIAKSIGNPKAYRAVGLANNKNPIAIIIPCHRVIGSNGELTGYAGGLEIKKSLLKIEKECNSIKVL